MKTRQIIEMLRVSYQHGATHVLKRMSVKEEESSSFLKTSESYLSIAGSILGECRVTEAHATGSPRAALLSTRFYRSSFCSNVALRKRRPWNHSWESFSATVLKTLTISAICRLVKSTSSLLDSTLCDTLRSFVTSETNKMGGTGVLHDLIMNSLQTETADVITKRVVVYETGCIVDSIHVILQPVRHEYKQRDATIFGAC